MKTEFLGKVKAYASELNPLQTIVEFVLTDFEPNKNNQRIPKAEAENVINTAKNMPIKINFMNNKVSGHAFSVPIGTLSDVWLADDAVMARSVIWKDEFPEVDNYLRSATSEGRDVCTSWEIMYESAIETDGVTDLYGCLVAATTIVDNPAYGNRTRILSIAESLNLMDELEQLRESFINIIYALDEMYAEAMQQEVQKTAIEDASRALERVKELFLQLQASKAEAETKLQEAETTRDALKIELEDKLTALQSRVSELENEKAQAEQERAKSEVLKTRVELLKEAGITLKDEQINERKARYLAMSEEQFQEYRDDLISLSRSIKIPDTLHSGVYGTSDIVKAFKEKGK